MAYVCGLWPTNTRTFCFSTITAVSRPHVSLPAQRPRSFRRLIAVRSLVVESLANGVFVRAFICDERFRRFLTGRQRKLRFSRTVYFWLPLRIIRESFVLHGIDETRNRPIRSCDSSVSWPRERMSKITATTICLLHAMTILSTVLFSNMDDAIWTPRAPCQTRRE